MKIMMYNQFVIIYERSRIILIQLPFITSPSNFHVLPTSNSKFIKITNKAVSIADYNLTSKKKKKKKERKTSIEIHVNSIQKKKAYIE